MDSTIVNSVLLPLLGAVGVAVATAAALLFNTLINLLKVFLSQANSKIAVRAVEQLHPTLPNEQKKELALALAQKFNTDAGIKMPDEKAVLTNESHVLELPPTHLEYDDGVTDALG